MKNWKNNNQSGIIEYPFDFKRYIEERLREIDDRKEREFAKGILVDGIGKIIDVTEAKYQRLENQVFKEFEIEANHYGTVMTIVNRASYDPNNHSLYPLVEADLHEMELKQSLSADNELWVGTIFMETSEKKIREFKNSKYTTGIARVAGSEDRFSYQIRPAARYRSIIEMLYQIFLDNHVTWETIHTGYLTKFFDVYAILEEEFAKPVASPGRIRRERFFQSLSLENKNLSFGEFEGYVRYDVIPLWNIEWITFNNDTFMVPCVDGIYYEHTFRPEKQGFLDGYLIQNNQDILNIRHEKEGIVIKFIKENFDNWKAVRIIQTEVTWSPEYTAPFLTNRKRDSFIRRYAERNGTRLITKAELFRKIMEIQIQDYIEVVDYEINKNTKEYPIIEGMNWFVNDHIFPMDSRRVLVFYFKEKQPEHYLNDGMVQFVISQMQLGISEYRLIGEII